MNRKHIITIAGQPGSGKSTTARLVAEKLGYQHFSSGDLFRAVAKEEGIELTQANQLSQQSDHYLDRLVDGRLVEIGKTQDNIAIDSRLAWHWIPQSFKVYLDLDIEIAASRILGSMSPERIQNEHIPSDPAEYAKTLQHRLDLEATRYRAKYDVNPYNHDNYDLVIDTEKSNIEQVVSQVIEAYQRWLKN